MSVHVEFNLSSSSVAAGRLHNLEYRGFASANYTGVHPEVIAAVQSASEGHVTAYGEDVYTRRLLQVAQAHFDPKVTAFPVFNATASNVLALQALLPRGGAAVCATTAHINTDENGAPEGIAGLATPADTAMVMQLGADGVFVGSGMFKSRSPAQRAAAVLNAISFFDDPDVITKVSRGLGAAIVGINVDEIPSRTASPKTAGKP